MKHLALVPLIGGMAIGAEKTLNLPPEAVVSYGAFMGNDKFLLQYYKQRGLSIPYHSLDETPNVSFSDIDIITSVCPCSGLSTVNTRAGAGCQQNEWMRVSTKWALEYARPRVLVGENAHTLATNMGRPVAQDIRDIGKEFGYTMSMMKTSTHLHGIPQERTRAFFILWRDTPPAVLEYQDAQYEGTWLEYLDSFGESDSFVEDWHRPMQEEIFSVLRTKYGSDRAIVDECIKRSESGLTLLLEMEEDVVKIVEEHLDNDTSVGKRKLAARLDRILKKRVADPTKTGIWDISPRFRSTKNFRAVMWKNISSEWRPDELRSINVREQMRLMGLPEEMEIPKSYPNAVCQNVPTCTAAWIVSEIVQALEGKRDGWDGNMSNDGILRQNNINRKQFK